MRHIVALLVAGQMAFGCESVTLLWSLPAKADPLFRFEEGDKVGFIDVKGEVVIRPTLKPQVDGAFFSGMLSLGSSSGPFLDMTGQTIPFEGFYRVWNFDDGLAAALQTSGKAPWGYVDRSGKWAISPRFPSYPAGLVSDFSEGLAAVETEGKVGYIDQSGQFVIQQQFALGAKFEQGVARVVVAGPCRYYSRDVCDGLGSAPGTGPSRLNRQERPECRWSFIDSSGKPLFPGDFDDALDFHDGLAAVNRAGKWGYIDKRGTFVINPRFDSAESFSEGMAWVNDGGTGGYVDTNGQMQFMAKHGGAFSAGRTFVTDSENGYIYVDKTGRQVIPERFALAGDFRYGLAHVKLSGKNDAFAYIDVTGKHLFSYRGRM